MRETSSVRFDVLPGSGGARSPKLGWIVVVALALAAMACSGSIGDPQEAVSAGGDNDVPNAGLRTPNGAPVSSTEPGTTTTTGSSANSPNTPADAACAAQS